MTARELSVPPGTLVGLRAIGARTALLVRRNSVMLVLAFWWMATGVLYALQRSAWTRGLALAGALACLGAGARLTWVTRADRSAAGVQRAFFGGALAWTAVITLFFEGWLVGPPPGALGPATRGWAGALEAVRATWHWEALALLGLVLLAVALRGATQRVALATYALFWAAHQSAKLNLFVGVVNPGTEIFPPYLAHLPRYFGPARNAPLLWVTIAAYTALAGWWLSGAWRGSGEARVRRLVLGALAGLVALEHGFLATRLPIQLWELFLRVGRG